MKNNWLWDRKIPASKIDSILKDDNHERFAEIAALLLSRNNVPREVFDNYLDKKIFFKNWPKIKKNMRRNNWNDHRITFWQAVYEQLTKMFKEEGVKIPLRRHKPPTSEICLTVGKKIKKLREEARLTQKGLSEKLCISQQVVSRIERGRDNVSLGTLQKFSKALGKDISVDFI